MKFVCETCDSRFEASRRRRFCSRSCRPSERPYAADPGSIPPTGDLTELTALLWTAARRGSVEAVRILLRESKAGPGAVSDSVIDQLARRRLDGGGTHNDRNEEET